MLFTFLKKDKIPEVRTIYDKYHLQLQKDDWWKRIIVYEAGEKTDKCYKQTIKQLICINLTSLYT